MKDRVYKSIIDSAEKLFNRFGPGKTAVSDIAEMAEVSRATIFNNFGSKEGIIEAVLKEKTEDFRKYCKNLADSGESSVRQIKMILLERIRMLQELNFISDKSLKLKRRYFENFIEDLNEILVGRVTNILTLAPGEIQERGRIVNNIFFMLRGIEQSIFDRFGRIELKSVEQDMDFFLKQLLTGVDENRSIKNEY